MYRGGCVLLDRREAVRSGESWTPGKLAGSGFSFQKLTRRNIAEIRADRSPAELVDLLRARIDARTAPPGPATSWLGETIVHGEGIFRALGGYRSYPVRHVVAVADFYKNSNLLIGAKRRISGVRLRATDTDWQHGDGPEVADRSSRWSSR